MNVPFSPTICEGFIEAISYDSLFDELYALSKKIGVPSIEVSGSNILSTISSIKKPERSIDIGCGIGVSTLSIIKGYPKTQIVALDSNSERYAVFEEYFKGYENITHIQARAENFLKESDTLFDFAFVDSVKREYATVWQLLKKRLKRDATVIFDDILCYGYVLSEESETPFKYQSNRRLMLDFINEIFSDKSLQASIIPASGGLLLVQVNG